MEGFLANLVKYLLFATNFLVFVMAFIVLCFSVYALVDGESLTELVASASGDDVKLTLYSTAIIILIVVSIFVMIVAFFGCCGAMRENRCMLGIYFLVILCMFVIMIVGAVIGYSQSISEIKEPLMASIPKYDPSNEEMSKLTTAWDNVQMDYKCCGLDGFQDWEANQNLPSNQAVPKSCCEKRDGIDDVDACMADPASVPTNSIPGCFSKLDNYIQDNATNILGVAVGIVIVMFLNMIFAFAMCTMAD